MPLLTGNDEGFRSWPRGAFFIMSQQRGIHPRTHELILMSVFSCSFVPVASIDGRAVSHQKGGIRSVIGIAIC